MKASANKFPHVLFSEGAVPDTPTTGVVKIYAKSDGAMYSMDDTGAETELGGGGGGSGDVTGPASSTDGNLAVFDGATGKLLKDGGPPASASDELTLITEASAFTAAPATHSGRSKLILAGGDVTFDTAESYALGNVFNIRATAALTLAVTGVTLTAPAGGTLALDSGMAVTVAMTGAAAGVVIGQTVAA